MIDGHLNYILVALSPYLLYILSTTVLSFYCLKSLKRNEVKAFSLYLFAQLLWAFGYIFEITAETLEGKIWWDDFQLIGYALIGVIYPVFTFLYTRYFKKILFISSICIGISSLLIYILLLIGDPNGLVRQNSRIIPDTPFNALYYDFGIMYQLLNFFVFAFGIISIVALLMNYRKKRGNIKKQAQFLTIGIVIPFVGGYLSVLGYTFFQEHRDSSPTYFFVSNIFIFIAFFRYGLFSSYESILPSIFNMISDGIIIVDENQIVIGMNTAARHLLSIESAGSNFPIEIGLKKHPAIIKLTKLPYEFGKREQIELELFSRGSLRTFEMKRYPIFNALRKRIGYFLILHDIHDSKLIETQLRKEKNEISEKAMKEKQRLELQLQQAQKMESIGRLAGGIAHDFNNMLTGIMGNIELLKMAVEDNPEVQGYLAELEAAAKSASNLTRSLLSFSRKQMVNPVRLNINDLIDITAKMFKRLIGEDIILNLNLEDLLPEIIADPGSIQQALLNLVVNARDAMPRGGTLIIETKNCFLDQNYVNSHILDEPGSYIMLAVSDTGTGMSDEVKSHLFEPFFTTKAKDKGTGLGLASVYAAVTQAEGRIEVYSELNYGTTFKLYFPIAEPEQQIKPKNHELTLLENYQFQIAADNVKGFVKEVESGERSATIALVEDDNKVRNVIVQGLTKKGYNVLSFSDPVEALDSLKVYNGALDLLITDVVMPKMNGKQLAESLEQQFKAMKVLYISGYTENIIFHHGVLDPNVNFLSKPFTPEALLQIINKILG